MYSVGYSIGYLIGVLVAAVIFGAITKHISESKGYSGGFAWGFWLTWIGVIVVACKPNLNTQTQQQYRPMYPNAVQEKRQWHCVCGASNNEGASYCFKCRRSRYESDSVRKEACPHCGAMNKSNNETCFACNKPMKVLATPTVAAEKPVEEKPAENESAQVIDMLKKLGELHDTGVLTDEEFQLKKNALLEKL